MRFISILILIFVTFQSLHQIECIPSYKTGINGNTTTLENDSNEILNLILVMKKMINKHRYLYSREFTAEELNKKLNYPKYAIRVLEATKQQLFINLDGNSNLKSRRIATDPKGYQYVRMEDYSLGFNYNLLLEFDFNERYQEELNQEEEQQLLEQEEYGCKYIKIIVFLDPKGLYSISEFLCFHENQHPTLVKDQLLYEKYNYANEKQSFKEEKENRAAEEEEEEKKSVGRIKIMSYNLWNYNEPWKKRRHAIADIIEWEEPDIIGFQEARYSSWEGENKKTLKSPTLGGQERNQVHHLWNILAYRNKKYHYTYLPSMIYLVNGLQDYQMEGLAFFSKYPILEISSTRLSRDPSDNEDDHQRSCLRIMISIDNGMVGGKTYHLNIFTSHFSLGTTSKLRNSLDSWNFISQYPRPHVFMGDFNSEPQDSSITYLTTHLKDTWLEYEQQQQQQNVNGFTFPTLHGNPIKRIDYILKSSDNITDKISLKTNDFQILGAVKSINDIYPSDHTAIQIEFEILEN